MERPPSGLQTPAESADPGGAIASVALPKAFPWNSEPIDSASGAFASPHAAAGGGGGAWRSGFEGGGPLRRAGDGAVSGWGMMAPLPFDASQETVPGTSPCGPGVDWGRLGGEGVFSESVAPPDSGSCCLGGCGLEQAESTATSPLFADSPASVQDDDEVALCPDTPYLRPRATPALLWAEDEGEWCCVLPCLELPPGVIEHLGGGGAGGVSQLMVLDLKASQGVSGDIVPTLGR